MEQLMEYVNLGEWSSARARANQLKKEGESSDTFWVLNSTIYQAEGNIKGRYLSIIMGLSKNPYNYELYYMLGEYYSETNINQAVICMQQALLYCDSKDDYSYILSCVEGLKQLPEYRVNSTSILITSHADRYVLEDCVETIEKTLLRDTYEIIVAVDSYDESIIAWIKSKDIKYIKVLPESKYGAHCNEAIKVAAKDNDVLFLHSDIELTPNAFFWLKMGLYENDNVGATGSVTNEGSNNQSLAVSFDIKEQYLAHSVKINLPSENPYERKLVLSEFCVLISRLAIDDVGSFDEDYELANYTMADYGIYMSVKGYKLLLCHNSFVYHNNVCSVDKACVATDENKIIKNNNYLKEKCGNSITYYLNLRYDLIRSITADSREAINILEVGCGCGITLSKIKYLYPNATVYGIELIDSVAKLGKNIVPIISGNIEDMELDYEPETLDYILFGDVLEHLRDPAATIVKLRKFLKPNGKIVASIPNLMHLSVIIPLLKGEFTYADDGLLDRTHIHFFTKNEIIKMFKESGYRIESICSMTNVEANIFIEKNQDFIKQLYRLPGIAPALDFESFQYLVVAENVKS